MCCTGCTAAALLLGADLRPELQGLQSQSQPQPDETQYHDAQAGMFACSNVACARMPRLGWPSKDETDGSCRALSSADNSSMSNSSPGCHRPAVPNSVYSHHGEGEFMVGLRLRTLHQQHYTVMLPQQPTAQHARPWKQEVAKRLAAAHLAAQGYRLTTPESEPAARRRLSGAQARAVLRSAPSSWVLCRQRCMRRSQVWIVPPVPVRSRGAVLAVIVHACV